MTITIKLLGISGSLRKKAYSTAALRAAQSLVPEGVTMEIFDLSEIPMYNDDVREKGYPEVVQAFRQKIAAADGVVMSTPEYNYSTSGVLKNAIDWASRPPEQPFEAKPIALISSSPGGLGGSRAQYHLRQMFVFMNGLVINRPEVMIAAVNKKFDDAGKLNDEPTREILAKQMAALVDFIKRHNRP
jgi:chromate reductase, NAD(P)H dehydrogenase (quinone)